MCVISSSPSNARLSYLLGYCFSALNLPFHSLLNNESGTENLLAAFLLCQRVPALALPEGVAEQDWKARRKEGLAVPARFLLVSLLLSVG